MAGNYEPKKRIAPAVSTPGGVINVERVHTVDGMLNRALGTLDEQLTKLSIMSRSATFTEKEARVLQGYIKSLVELSREERERDKANRDLGDLGNLTPEQLLELAQKELLGLKDSK